MNADSVPEPTSLFRELVRRKLDRNAFLRLRDSRASMPFWAMALVLAVLVALRVHCVVSMFVAWQGWGLDPRYWAPSYWGLDAPAQAAYATPFLHHPNVFGQRWGFQAFVAMHIVTGVLLFATCLVPLFTKKGARAHVVVGRVFVVVWLVHLVDGLINSAQILITRGFEPTRYFDTSGEGFSLYLYVQFAFISSMVIDFLAHGLTTVHYKNRVPAAPMRALMIAMPSITFVFGLGIAVWGALRLMSDVPPETPNTIPFAVVFLVQIPPYLYLLGKNIAYWVRAEPRAWLHGWLTEHQRNMTFCVQVTLYTGVANVTARHAPQLTPFLFASIDLGFLVWLLWQERALRQGVIRARMALAFVSMLRVPPRTSAEPAPRVASDVDVRWVLRVLDLDGDGRLGEEELDAVLRAQGVTLEPAELERLRAGMDADGDGAIDRQELGHALARYFVPDPTDGDGVELAFRQLDLDGDGRIDAEELARGLGVLELDAARRILDAVDLDGSGGIDRAELRQALAGG